MFLPFAMETLGGWSSLWGNSAGETAGVSLGKVQGVGGGRDDQPTLGQAVFDLDAS